MTEHRPENRRRKLPRYLGTWYEIARLPMRHEPEGCTDVSAHYTLLDNGNVGVTNRCRMDGEIEEATGEACAVDNDSARLEVSFLPGPALAAVRQGRLLGDPDRPGLQRVAGRQPDRKYLWLLAREPRLDATVQDHYLAAARLQGFDLSELIQTPHTGKPTA